RLQRVQRVHTSERLRQGRHDCELCACMHCAPHTHTGTRAPNHVRSSIGIHWGTFPMTDEPQAEPPVRLATAVQRAGLASDAFIVVKHGETWPALPAGSGAGSGAGGGEVAPSATRSSADAGASAPSG